MNAFRQIFVETKYVGPSNHRGPRVKAINVTSRKYIYVGFHAGANNMDAHEWAARILLNMQALDTDKQGGPYEGDLLSCGTKTGYIFTAKP
jgi:hypothetical protein